MCVCVCVYVCVCVCGTPVCQGLKDSFARSSDTARANEALCQMEGGNVPAGQFLGAASTAGLAMIW